MGFRLSNETRAVLTIMQVCKCTSEEVYDFIERVGGVHVLSNKLDGVNSRQLLVSLYNNSVGISA